ncbi:hypothetical protein ES705_43533 [subsurface metagenome]
MKKRTGESMKDLMLGEGSYKKKPTSKTVKRQTDKPAKQDTVNKKATYYIRDSLVKRLKYLAIEKERGLSSLVSEAIEDLLKKYEK